METFQHMDEEKKKTKYKDKKQKSRIDILKKVRTVSLYPPLHGVQLSAKRALQSMISLVGARESM